MIMMDIFSIMINIKVKKKHASIRELFENIWHAVDFYSITMLFL